MNTPAEDWEARAMSYSFDDDELPLDERESMEITEELPIEEAIRRYPESEEKIRRIAEQEEISPLEQAIADEDFEQILALLDEARRQVIKQAMKRGFAMFSPSLTDESVRRPV